MGFLLLFAIILIGKVCGPAANQNVNDDVADKTLLHVHVIWRHGERNPWNTLPLDTLNNIKTWPGGLKQFTRRGIEQNFHLGKLIRKRYRHFISNQFHANEIYVRSSDEDRALMAAQSTLAGLYHRDKGLQQVDNLNPIPVHTIPYRNDQMLNDRIHCPVAEQEELLLYESNMFRKYERENEELLKLLGLKTGLGTGPLPFSEVWKVWEPLNSELLNPETHSTPNWLTIPLWKRISVAYNQYSYSLFDSATFRRLRSGPLVSKILDQMELKAQNANGFTEQKMYAISAHDSTIAGFLRAFDIRPENNQLFVRLFHRNDTATDDIFEVMIPQCEYPCTLERMRELAAPVLPSNWPLECKLEIVSVTRDERLDVTFLLCIVFGALTVFSSALLIYTHVHKRLYPSHMAATVNLKV